MVNDVNYFTLSGALFACGTKTGHIKFYYFFRTAVRRLPSVPSKVFLGMEHSSLDLSIVKKEPGFDEPFSSGHGIFDNMMSDEFHDTSFHSVVSGDSIHRSVS